MLSTPESLIGSIIQGRYRILDFLAEGAMGAVYSAERLGLERKVAIKFLNPAFAVDPQASKRFEREARAMSRLDHPNCVSVIDFGVTPAPFIVMEYVTGETLREVLDQGPVSVERALYLCDGVLAGLAHAHQQNIVHRDIKPANVMVTAAAGTQGLVRILDFGLAKLRGGVSSDLSAAWIVVGTPNYMSPEQGQGSDVDRRTDIYATGVLLFELLTGNKPFAADEAIQVLLKHREEPVPRLAEVAPGLVFPAGIQEVIDRAMAKSPNDRFATAIEFANALRTLEGCAQSRPVLAAVPTPPIPGADDVAGKDRKLRPVAATQPLQAFELDEKGIPLPQEPGSSSSAISTSEAPTIAPGKIHRTDTVEPTIVPDSQIMLAEPPSLAPLPKRRSGGARWLVMLIAAVLVAGGVAAAAGVGPFALESGVEASGTAEGSARAEPEAKPVKPRKASEARKGDQAAEEAIARQEPAVEPAVEPADEQQLPPDASMPAVAEALDEVLDGVQEILEEDEESEPEEALSAEDLAADALDVDPPVVDEPSAPADIVVNSIADANELIAQGKTDGAIAGLRQLARKSPKNAQISYLLGNLYFDKMWWSLALQYYGQAIAKDRKQSRKPILIKNAIHAMGSSKTRRKAQLILRYRVGKPALPLLRKAGKSDKSPMVRKGAAYLVKAMSARPKKKTSKKRRRRPRAR